MEKGTATHYSILAWGSPWTEEPGGLQAIGSQGHKESDMNEALGTHSTYLLYFQGKQRRERRKITADSNCSHETEGRLLLERKAKINLDSGLKSKDITLQTKVCTVKAMVFPVVMYECKS